MTKFFLKMSKKERLNLLIEHYSNGNKTQFANKLGISPQGLSTWLSRDMYDIELIYSKCENVSAEWLLTGSGPMLIDEIFSQETQASESDKKLIPFFDDITTVGGHNETVSIMEISQNHVSEWIDAGDWFPEATAAIRHYGDSMVEYPSGSILALKRVHDKRLIINGRNYVIETTEFRVTKQLQDDGGDYIMAYSSNRETYPDGRQIHSPIRIPKDTIRSIDLVLGCVLKEYSNGALTIRK